MYWSLILWLLGGSFVADILFSYMFGALLMVMAALQRRAGESRPVSFIALTVAVIAQVYFWAGWAAYCATLVVVRALDPAVTYPWAYYITGALFVGGPLGYLMHKERAVAKSSSEVRNIQRGTDLYWAVTFVGFVLFCFSPWLMVRPYGWFLRFIV